MTAAGDRSVVGARVLAARQRAALTREELAVKTGLSWSAITQIESGRRPSPRGATLGALARALGVTTDYLLGHAGPTPSLLNHHALIYSGLDDFLATAAPVVTEGVGAEEATLVVTNRRNAAGLRDRLGPVADRARFEDSEGWYRSPRAAFAGYRDFAAQALAEGATWVRIVAEPVWQDRAAEEISRWGRYESLLNLAFAAVPLTLVCPYDESALPREIMQHAGSAHCHTLARGEKAPSREYQDPAEFCLGD